MDYAFLRQEAISYIQKLSGNVWTDHNIHDPGITTLELLAYTITDLGYRTEYAIKDILANNDSNGKAKGCYTPAQILASNPLTISDYRKLLLDVTGIKNVWLEPIKKRIEHINIKGLYDIMVELEYDERWGDLNKRSIKMRVEQGPYAQENMFIELSVVSELDWYNIDSITQVEMQNRQRDFFKYGDFLYAHQANLQLHVKLKDGTRSTVPLQIRVDLLGDENPQDFIIPSLGIGSFIIAGVGEQRARINNNWFLFVYDENEPIPLEEDDILLNEDTYAVTIIELLTGKQFLSALNVEYLPKQSHITEIMQEAKRRLSITRNLCEDFNDIKVVFIQDIAINAHIEIKPDADPEYIFAEIYHMVDQYLSPGIKKYSIEQLLEKEKEVCQIFEGILPQNGFIDDNELQKIEKKTIIYTSSIINIIMDIPGVLAVKNIDLTHYINGLLNLAHQPDFIPLVNPSLYMPRVSADKSNMVFYKNNVVEKYNAKSAINHFELLKQRHRQAPTLYANDIPIEKGKDRHIEQYNSIQNDFPPVYGIGNVGLAHTESAKRRAEAMQFKAYLLFCEQLLANYLSQLANVNTLFDHSPDFVPQTYFFQSLTDVSDIDKLIKKESWNEKQQHYNALLGQLTEKPEVFLERKNRFLDHIMARFGEQYTEYTQLMYAIYNEKATDMHYIADRINGEQFEQSLKDSISAVQYSLEEMIRRSIKMEVKQGVVALLQKYGTDVKVADAAKEAIKEVLRTDIQKTLGESFREAVQEGIKNGIDDIISEIAAELVKKAGDDSKKLEHIIKERKIIKARLESLANQEADKIFIGISQRLFEATIKSAVFNGIDQLIDEVMQELLAGKITTEKDNTTQKRTIEDTIKSIIIRSVSNKVKKTIFSAVKNVVWAARDRVSREMNAQTRAELINHKIAFLNDYPNISSLRGQGTPYSYTNNTPYKFTDTAGFVRRVARLLGIDLTQNEHFYLIEHILIRPDNEKLTQRTNELFAALRKSIGIESLNRDNFSFQMSLIAPNYKGRFTSERFRKLFEKTIQMEAPAHLVVYMQWFDEEKMDEFKNIYMKLNH